MPSCQPLAAAVVRPPSSGSAAPWVLLLAVTLALITAPPLLAQGEGGAAVPPTQPGTTATEGDATAAPPAGGAALPATLPRVLCAYRVRATGWGGGATSVSSADAGSEGATAAGGSAEGASGEGESAEPPCPGKARAGLGDRIAVRVDNLGALLSKAGECGKVVLFIDRTPLENTPPAFCELGRNEVVFDLVRNAKDQKDDKNEKNWSALLGSPEGLSRVVELSLGADGQQMLDSDVEDFELVILSPVAFSVFLLLLAVALAVFFKLAATTPMLRDSQTEASGQQRPYSLSRCQMAWWFFLVIAAFVFIWMVLGELDTITGSILGLMGISSATALGAATIDASKKASEQAAEQKKATASRVMNTAASLSSPSTDQMPAMMQVQLRAAQVTSEAEDLQGAVKKRTRGVMRDLLWDGDGISFHRFQIAVWTVVLGVIFVYSVYGGLKMPEFSPTLLSLMGISSGTYLGLKLPERPGRENGGDGS